MVDSWRALSSAGRLFCFLLRGEDPWAWMLAVLQRVSRVRRMNGLCIIILLRCILRRGREGGSKFDL
jgi:hypothetical protein